MKKTIILATLLMISAGIPGATAQTQTELNTTSNEMFRAADEELNATYAKFLAAYADDKAFLTNLQEAQRCWIAFRDAQLRMKYPEREPGYYGSIQPVCEATYLTELTEERTKALQVWLDGGEEGNGCAGSVRVKQ